jgi:diguanylate cyclase (GGDEF)-like protein/PAS domain S-box-containing protein
VVTRSVGAGAEASRLHDPQSGFDCEQFAPILEQAHDAIVAVDGSGNVVFFNRGAERIFGWRAAEVVGGPLDRLLPSTVVEAHRHHLAHFRQGPDGSRHMTERARVRGRRRDGTEFPARASIQKLDTRDGALMVAILSDVSMEQRAEEEARERIHAEQALAHLALHDALTGLPNRALLGDRIRHALERRSRRGGTDAVLFLDLDRFKVVNDSMGHAAGDALLVEAARRLSLAVRAEDTVARFGGDEFVVLCEDVKDAAEVEAVAQRLVSVFDEPFHIGGRRLFVHASVGIALAQGASLGPEELIRNADTAMYVAKARGRNQHVFFDEALRQDAVRRVEVEEELRDALKGGGLHLVYQPIACSDQLEVKGVEALLRWSHPTRGTLAPEAFLSIAEETDLIVPIDTRVLRMACRQLATWDRAGLPPLPVAVNVSARLMAQRDAVDRIRRTLAETGVAPQRLMLEITESVMMGDDAVAPRIAALRAMGVRIAVDDFGTGYASLAYLQRVPVDTVKIDRSFVAGLGPEESDGHAIIRGILALAEALRLDVVAEGVETRTQLDALRALGCECVQGHLLTRPLTPDALTDWLR